MLQKYHMPTKVQNLLHHYFESFEMRFVAGEYTTDWQRLEVGIVTGCTNSIILFTAAMNLPVKSAEVASRGSCTACRVQKPPTRAFMDEMTITARSIMECRWMLETWRS